MATLPEFSPENASFGRTGSAVLTGMEEGSSLMNRAQAMRIAQQRADQEQAEFVAKLPLIQAQAQLTQVNAATAVKNATERTNYETRAAAQSTQFNQELQDILAYDASYDVPASDGTPEGDAEQEQARKFATQKTLDYRSKALAGLQAKSSYMELLPQYKGFVDTVKQQAAQAHLDVIGNLKLEELTNAARLRTDASMAAAQAASDAKVRAAEIAAGAKRSSAEIYTGSRERIAQISSDTKLTMQDRAAKIAAEKQGATIEDLSARAAEADQLAADASAAGDEQSAAVHRQVASSYRDAIQKTSTFAGQQPQAVPTKSPAPRPHAATPTETPSAAVSISIPGSDVPGADQGAQPEAPDPEPVAPVAVAPLKVDPKADAVTIGGKVYPIFKDAKGRRAYKIDGHYVPITTQ